MDFASFPQCTFCYETKGQTFLFFILRIEWLKQRFAYVLETAAYSFIYRFESDWGLLDMPLAALLMN